MARLWNRLISFDDQRITKLAFEFDYERCRNNWCFDFKDILIKLDLVSHFERKEIIDMSLLDLRLQDFYLSMWKRDIINVSKLRTYVKLKTMVEQESYVKLNLSKSQRSCVAQLRCGILPLRIETGRYIGEQREERICNFCTENSIEDESHFVLDCSLYTELRNEHFKDIISDVNYLQMSNDEKLYHILINFPRKTAKYLVDAIRKRRQVVFGQV
ncbi:Hypothetical predicted protein [Mytilus galloprovincialis]|uniref:Reverse transcriptase zinc-binding domain-containing protein n=1 Tax=Mytilus galloprovincialis TaxID=29158 RepID=A0A8B6FKY8_MYTGA|nr:Hypothetical predicted protein [Mytilus galloprovincialis]